ncbi:hypothetical protein [Methylobacterium brachiatum]
MVDSDTFIVVGIAAVVLFVAWLLRGPSKASTPPVGARRTEPAGPAAVVPDPVEEAAVRRAFANVFSMLSRNRQEDLVQHRIRAKGCSRIEAMRSLLKDRGVDEVKYDS